MNSSVKISTLNVGDEIIVGLNRYNSDVLHHDHSCNFITAYLISKLNGNYIIGLLDNKFIGWTINSSYFGYRSDLLFRLNIKYGWEVNHNLRVLPVPEKIISPDLVCESCKKPAPHSLSDKGKFICILCNLLSEL